MFHRVRLIVRFTRSNTHTFPSSTFSYLIIVITSYSCSFFFRGYTVSFLRLRNPLTPILSRLTKKRFITRIRFHARFRFFILNFVLSVISCSRSCSRLYYSVRGIEVRENFVRRRENCFSMDGNFLGKKRGGKKGEREGERLVVVAG